MFGDAVGLLVSFAVWLAGVYSSRRVTALTVASLPTSWSRHPLGTEYGAFLEPLSPRDLQRWAARALPWYALWIGLFLILSLADVPLWLSLVACPVVASYYTSAEVGRERSEFAAFVREQQLEPPVVGRPLIRRHTASSFAMWLGFLATACFIGDFLARVV